MHLRSLIAVCHSKWLGPRRCGSSQIINFFTIFWFAVLCITSKTAMKLAVFVLPYLTILSFAVFTLNVVDPQNTVDKQMSSAWISFHILMSLSTYATISLATMAAFSVFLSQLLIKNKRSNIFVNFLPAINEADRLQTILLVISLFCSFYWHFYRYDCRVFEIRQSYCDRSQDSFIVLHSGFDFIAAYYKQTLWVKRTIFV